MSDSDTPKSEQNRVRQVLMNELGLTRESIRAEVVRIVDDTIERMLAAPDIQDRISNVIAQKVGQALSKYASKDELERFVKIQAEKEASEQVRTLLRAVLCVEIGEVQP